VSRSRGHRLLQLDLAAATGVPVEIRWDSSSLSADRPRKWAWHVIWSDGPTVAAMRAKAEQHAADLTGVDADQLVYSRTVQPQAYALAMIRQVRFGRPPLGDHRTLWGLTDWLDNEPYPERGTPDELELAARLVRLSRGLEAGMVELLDRHGLAALTGSLDTGNVTPIRRQP
jgi:hypothetical protein